MSGCCTMMFNAELTPGQQKALENAFNRKVIENDFLADADDDTVVKVVDRTALILDIFAQHTRTREGKLQVDLALHEYCKPRLTRMWTHLADEGCARHPDKVKCPANPCNPPENLAMQGRVRPRHETLNGWLKNC